MTLQLQAQQHSTQLQSFLPTGQHTTSPSLAQGGRRMPHSKQWLLSVISNVSCSARSLLGAQEGSSSFLCW